MNVEMVATCESHGDPGGHNSLEVHSYSTCSVVLYRSVARPDSRKCHCVNCQIMQEYATLG